MMLSVIGLLIVCGLCRADYDCLCSYDVEKPVLNLPTHSSQAIGYMYEFDCKPIMKVNGTDTTNWTAVAFEKQLGYVEMDGQLQVQICPGDPSPTDTITTQSTVTSNTQTMSVVKLSSQSHSQTHSTSTTASPTPVPSSAPSTSFTTTNTPTSTSAPSTTKTKPPSILIKLTQSSTVPTKSTTRVMKNITTTALKPLPFSMATNSKPSSTIRHTYSTSPSTTRQPSAATTSTQSTVTQTTRHQSTSITTSQSTTLSITHQPSTTTTTTQSTSPTTTHQQLTLNTKQLTTPTKHLPTTTIHRQTTSSTTTRSTTTSRPTTRTIHTAVSTIQPTGMIPASLGNTTLCSSSVVQYAQQDGEILTQLGDSCYTIVPHRFSWSHAEAMCNHRGGHLFHVRNAGENLFFYITLNTRFNHSVWMGLHDTIREEHFQWTSGTPLNYTNWLPGRKSNFMSHNIEDCAIFVPYKDHGKWDDIVCGANSPLFEHIMEEHYFICQFPTRTQASAVHQVTSGNLNLCSSHLRFVAHMEGDDLGQYGTSCYEHIAVRRTWHNADQDCWRKGGHLLQIRDSQEEAYIQTFLTRVDSQHAVWIGLHDQGHEETFTWTSGEPLTYTNWLPGRRSNYFSHNVEDCVAMIPYKQGQWDDVPCGVLMVQSGFGVRQRLETHPYICEFHIASSGGPSLIGK